MSKRIHELAKEWGAPTKELVTKLEQIGVRGKRSQSTVTDEEASRLRVELGLSPKASVTVGEERVVGERLVTERGADLEVTAREQIVEARLRPNIIRRRAQRVEVVKREEIAPHSPDRLLDDGSLVDFPDSGAIVPPRGTAGGLELPPEAPSTPATAFLPPEDLIVPAARDATAAVVPLAEETPRPAVEAAAHAAPVVEETAIEVEPPREELPVETPGGGIQPAKPQHIAQVTLEQAEEAFQRSAEAEARKARSALATPTLRAPRSPATSHVAPANEVASPTLRPGRVAPQAPMLDDGMRRVQVLGKIDLKKAEPPPQRVRAATPASVANMPAPAAPAETTDEAGRRKKGKKVIRKPGQFDPFGSDRAGRGGRKPQKKRAAPGKEQRRTEITTPSARKRVVRFSEMITVGDLAKAMGLKAGEVIKKLMDMGVMATVNHVLDADHATLVASEFDYNVENVAFDADKEIEGAEGEESKGEAVSRDPVVTIMGHVDHGKTSLLDAIRQANVAEGEAGGITQHIGAYTVTVRDKRIAFLDTPGHEAFTAMRARGAQVTDLVILVVAADDGVMPQTVEAIAHARAAEVPIVVAVNKIDKPGADAERVKKELADNGLVPEDWGGDTIFVPVSAKTHEGIDQLLEMVLLQADVLELKANPQVRARGSIIEAKLDRGRGAVATVLVQEGTLKSGDPFVCGLQFGRVRAMLDEHGAKLDEARPSTPVEILGLSGVPDAGDAFVVVADEGTARQVAEHRRSKQRQSDMNKSTKVSLDEFYKQLEKTAVKELKVVLKVDVQGSVDALREALSRLSTDDVRLTILHASVGGVTESDVLLASASNAIIIGFNVRPEPKAEKLSEREGVDVRLYTVIYDAINQVREALEGLLEPTVRERTVGRAEVRQIFGVSGAGVVAGSSVSEGKIVRGAQARLLRDHAVIHEGRIGSLRRFKEDVREVAAGYECGIGLESYNDIKPGDVIEVFETEQVARRITPTQGASKAQLAERYA